LQDTSKIAFVHYMLHASKLKLRYDRDIRSR
jgi:hypothetical protein